PSRVRNGAIAGRTAARTASSPATSIARTAGPDEFSPRRADSSSGYSHVVATSTRSVTLNPAAAASSSSAPSAESANGPGVPGGGDGRSAPSARTYGAAS